MRYRNGYYDIKSPDLLKGKPEGKVLEAARRKRAGRRYSRFPQRALLLR